MKVVLGMIGAALAILGLALIFRWIGLFVMRSLDVEDECDFVNDPVSSNIFAIGFGAAAVAIVGLILILLYVIGTDMILPVFEG